MARWQPFDVVGGAYSDDTRPWSVQDTVNYLVVKAERPGARSSAILRGVPGMVTFSAEMTGPIRGLHNAEGRLFAVSGTTLYQIDTDGAAEALGTIPGVGRCVFAHNQITGGNQVVIGNGQSGYVWDTVAATLTQIADEGFPGFRSVDFADQYIIGVEPFGRYWFHSDLADATSYNTLDQSEAEKAPDRILQAIATGADVLVLGERTGQFSYNTGEATGTWANRPGTEMDVGAASPWTACRLDNTVYWLGHDGSVYRLAGYQPQRISTHALEQAISRSSMADAFAFTFEDRGHKCYLLTLPDGQTWCFDAATQEWTRRESYGLTRWRASALVKWNGAWIAGDYADGRLYQLDWAVQREADAPLERRRVTGVLHDDQNRMILNGLELVFDTGMDEQSPPLPALIRDPLLIAGNLPDALPLNDAIAPYSYTATGGAPGKTFAIVGGALPTGLSLSAGGEVTGTPTALGASAWTVRVTDGDGETATLADTAEVVEYWAPTASAFFIGGIRKLVQGYSGAAIRVRRVSDSVEQDIGFVNRTLDTATLALFAGSGSVEVVKIYKQAGAATDPDFVCADLTKRPLIVSAGTYLGYIKTLSSGTGMGLSNTGATNGGPGGGWVGMTACMKLGVPAAAAARYVFSKSDANAAYTFPNHGSVGWMGDDTNNLTVTTRDVPETGAARNKYPLASLADGTKLSAVWDTAASAPNQVKLYQDGVTPTETFVSSVAQPRIQPGSHYIGGNSGSQYSPCEVRLHSICIYEAALAPAVRESVEAAL